jgi:hypothetical protein
MGCDIHLHIEVKINGQWHHYGAPHIKRNYRLFAKMAGVRTENPGEAIIQPRGIPIDISLITKIDLDNWQEDGHHFSWLGAKEITELEDWLNLQGGQAKGYDLEWDILNSFLFSNSFTGFYRYPKKESKVQDVRFVFWFDN